jgi:hypothetical protein
VKELEVVRDELKKQALELTGERNAAKGTLADAHAAILGKAELLSTANNSIRDLKLKLEGLEGMLTDAKAREEKLSKALEAEKQERKNDAAIHKDYVNGETLWVGRLANVAGRITTQLATMGMPNVRYAPEPNVSPHAKLTLFFEGVLGALEQLRLNRAASLATEARQLCRGAMTKVLTKVAYWYPDLDFDAALESLLEDADLATLRERIKPVISGIDGIQRVEGQRRD